MLLKPGLKISFVKCFIISPISVGHIIVYVGNWCGVTIVFYTTFAEEDFGEHLGPWAYAISILAND